MPWTIRRATLADADAVAILFDQYRQFYRAPADLHSARRFIAERLANGDSVILLAPGGFTQLYPSFTSLGMARIFILNDLFVAPGGRRKGIGKALLRAAAAHAKAEGAARLTLSTEISNTAAQSLYESEGWLRDASFCAYNLQTGA